MIYLKQTGKPNTICYAYTYALPEGFREVMSRNFANLHRAGKIPDFFDTPGQVADCLDQIMPLSWDRSWVATDWRVFGPVLFDRDYNLIFDQYYMPAVLYQIYRSTGVRFKGPKIYSIDFYDGYALSKLFSEYSMEMSGLYSILRFPVRWRLKVTYFFRNIYERIRYP